MAHLCPGCFKPHEMRRLQQTKTLDPSPTFLIEDPVHIVEDDRKRQRPESLLLACVVALSLRCWDGTGAVPYEGLGRHGSVPYGSCRDNPLWLSAALLPSPLGRDFHHDIVGRLGPVEFLARGLEIER